MLQPLVTMDIAQLLKPWNQLRWIPPLSFPVPLCFLHSTFITTAANSALQRYTVMERNIVFFNIENVNYLKLIVCVVSDKYSPLKILKYPMAVILIY